ncbi:MAG: hypothetical protein IJY91_07350 [Oscillospiraceae bacterium]|nr:hypothetical protein [Oscillospiraceae bacterium]
MKKIHLICNSHLDPVWMWDWEEGLGESISTFHQAELFCREFDFIFNHNESVLYEFIEEHDPELFSRIQEQVRAGKWHIMGGWYLQPDCNMPSGEAFVRQIGLGRKYFAEKFGARPTTAINFDSFGHSVGLVQILRKCGYDSYICCRPNPEMMELPRDFWWVGKDGSRVKVTRTTDENLYCTAFGNAKNEVIRMASAYTDGEVGVALWGVGNHGGVPSRKDLEEVTELIANSDDPIVHSTPEQYFAELEPKTEFHKSMQPCLIGCYTAMQSIKQKHIELENKLFTTEKLCAYAALNGLYTKNEDAFHQAEKALAALEFHDIYSGTCASDGEKSSLRKAECALELLQTEFNKAFFALCGKHQKAEIGEFPVFIFNSQPYSRETVCETEYLMPNALTSDIEQYTVSVYQNGKKIPSQCVKELSNIHYDRRKRIAYRCTLPAFGEARVDFRVEVEPKKFLAPTTGDKIVFSDSIKQIRISRKTGLMESYIVNGKEMLSGGAFQPVMYEDNADPWGWYMERIGENPVPFALSDCKTGPFEKLINVNIIEDGDILTEVESFFELGASYVRISYKMYKDMPYTDVRADIFWNEQQKALKIKIPAAFDGQFIGQIPFGTDAFDKDGKEITAHRFVGFQDGENALMLYNDCTYGFSAQGNDLYATLLRGAAYCAHPIGDRILIDPNRFTPAIEQGRHSFSFRLSYDPVQRLENNAQEFVNTPFSLNFFPHGDGVLAENVLDVDNSAISLSAFYQTEEGYILRLVNNNAETNQTNLTLCGEIYALSFKKYEVKTYLYDGNSLTEKELWV